jgi:hypothetical protein
MHRKSNMIVCRSKPWIRVEKAPIDQRYTVLPHACMPVIIGLHTVTQKAYRNRNNDPPMRKKVSVTSAKGNRARAQKGKVTMRQGFSNSDHHVTVRRWQREALMKSENREEAKAERTERADRSG